MLRAISAEADLNQKVKRAEAARLKRAEKKAAFIAVKGGNKRVTMFSESEYIRFKKK